MFNVSNSWGDRNADNLVCEYWGESGFADADKIVCITASLQG